jgi:hypothetical protein
VNVPAVASKQTTSSALKRQEPFTAALPSRSRPLQPSKPGPVNVSKNTIGFPKAKAPPSILPKSSRPLQPKSTNAQSRLQVHQDDIHPKDFVEAYGQPPVGSRMHDRLVRHQLLEEKIEADEESSVALFDEDDLDQLLRGDLAKYDEEDVFQLEVPE